ncbi:hypothetical protein J2128_001626 [Methanomicrobium sp. W14]|uniref:carboxypeptidase regulatory-like domain-containing protein n=1 Tax=Methanomicrobium sp. W14 TaxID=2817839 RepID=UPI001AE89D17|nr:carboxypeptidase regulatory-like domain-containing protein [Methanomicrobium sp. W14]MBP2133672.1 hypothetical protein [Methanomicrobium sp. W14]
MLLLGMLCCTTVQASTTTITISVTDDTDNDPVSGASIYIAGSYVGTTNDDGIFEYTHSYSSSYRVGVKKSGYDYYSTLVSGSRTSLRVELGHETGVLTVNILDSDTLNPIEDAIVTITGDNIDKSDSTDDDGSVKFEVSYDSSYVVTVKKNNYDTLTKDVEMDDTSKIVDYLLQSSDLVIVQVLDGESGNSSPLAGAVVYVGGVRSGETGSDGKVNLNLEHERTYDIRVAKTGYEDYTEKHYFESDEILYSVTLSQSLYPVTVSVYNADKSPVSDANIYIDGSLFDQSDDYGTSSVTKLSSGEHTFLVKKSGYEDYQVKENINGTVDTIIAQLEYSKADVKIIVQDKDNSLVPNAVVSVNGENLGVTDEKGMITTELISNADYNFEITTSGYKELTDTRQVPLGTTEMTITFILEKKTNYLMIAIIIVALVILGYVAYNLKVNSGRRRRGGNQRRPPRKYDDGGL